MCFLKGGRNVLKDEKYLLVGASLGDKGCHQKALQVTRNILKIYQVQGIRGLYLSKTVLIECISTFVIQNVLEITENLRTCWVRIGRK